MDFSRESIFLKDILEKELHKKIDDNYFKKIKNKKITIIGAGGVGSILSSLLIRGGFENIEIIDNDIIDSSNLQRQIFFEKDIGKFKVEALEEILLNISHKANISIIKDFLNENNITDYLKNSDLIVDATDNFETRIVINDFCEKNNKDWIYNGAVKGEIICSLFVGKEKKFKKIFPENIKNESCCEVGVLSSTTHIGASICYNKILKYFLNIKDTYLIKYNIWNNQFHKFRI